MVILNVFKFMVYRYTHTKQVNKFFLTGRRLSGQLVIYKLKLHWFKRFLYINNYLSNTM